MVSIILAASVETKAAALAAGFRESRVLLKFDAVQSTDENKRRLETECRNLHPYQFLVEDYWGVAAAQRQAQRSALKNL